MEPRTFQAREIKEALALVRRELGPEAVIVGTRRVPGRALGLLGGSFVEVTAQGPDKTPAPGPGKAAKSKAAKKSDSSALLPERRAARRRRRAPVSRTIASDPATAIAAAGPRTVAPHATLRRRLLAAMVPRDLTETWLRQLPDDLEQIRSRTDEEAALRATLAQRLGPAAPLCPDGGRVVALVGATGVGKTTTVAKLAAHARLVEGRRVALVSMDDQRIGGASHLRAYGRVLEVPVTTCAEAGGLARALAAHRDAQLILVDTGGLSPARPRDFTELVDRLARAGEPVATHLTVTAATRAEELERLVHLFTGGADSGRGLRPHALLATKVDEAVAIGSLFAAQAAVRTSFSFITTGQQVPDDLAPADPNRLIDLLLGGSRA